MKINNLNDLVGKEVVFQYYDIDDNEDEILKETKGIVQSAYIEDYFFWHKWNEPLYLRISFSPIEDVSFYKGMEEDDYIGIFTDTYNLESITQIIK